MDEALDYCKALMKGYRSDRDRNTGRGGIAKGGYASSSGIQQFPRIREEGCITSGRTSDTIAGVGDAAIIPKPVRATFWTTCVARGHRYHIGSNPYNGDGSVLTPASKSQRGLVFP